MEMAGSVSLYRNRRLYVRKSMALFGANLSLCLLSLKYFCAIVVPAISGVLIKRVWSVYPLCFSFCFDCKCVTMCC